MAYKCLFVCCSCFASYFRTLPTPTLLTSCRVTLLRRFFTIYSTLMLMRSITIAVTTLPDSLPICQEMTPGTQPWYEINPRQVILRALKMSLPIGELSCGDLAVSGHSIILVMCAMLWHTYYPSVRGMNVVKFFMWLVCYAGLFAILLVRLHYTLDIILAVYLTITVWCQYHRIAHDVVGWPLPLPLPWPASPCLSSTPCCVLVGLLPIVSWLFPGMMTN